MFAASRYSSSAGILLRQSLFRHSLPTFVALIMRSPPAFVVLPDRACMHRVNKRLKARTSDKVREGLPSRTPSHIRTQVHNMLVMADRGGRARRSAICYDPRQPDRPHGGSKSDSLGAVTLACPVIESRSAPTLRRNDLAPFSEDVGPKRAERWAGDQVALDVEEAVDGGAGREDPLRRS